jgi:hypothetical protein
MHATELTTLRRIAIWADDKRPITAGKDFCLT